MAIQIDIDIQSAPKNTPQDDLEHFLDRVARAALTSEGWLDAEVSIRITGDEEVRVLNRMYRGIDEPTDVLSFPMLDFEDDMQPDDEVESPPLGDIVISWQRAVSQADEYGHSLERELAFLIVHGILHLLGYDHDDELSEKIMQEKQEAILAGLNIRR